MICDTSPAMFIYVEFTRRGKTHQVATIEAAKSLIVNRYPGAHFGDWEGSLDKRRLPVWPSVMAMLAVEVDGNNEPRYQPRAYICMEAAERTKASTGQRTRRKRRQGALGQ